MNEQKPAQRIATLERQISGFVQTHGSTRVGTLACGAVATLGALLPIVQTTGIFGGSSSFALAQAGFYGLVLLALPIGLGTFPIVGKSLRRFDMLAFGISSALFGTFFSLWIALSGVASAIGAPIGGLTVGFYLTLLGYAGTTVGYYLLAKEKPVLTEPLA